MVQQFISLLTSSEINSLIIRDVKIVFFLKIDYHLLKIDFFSIIVSDVTVTVGCSNVLHCCEV